MSNPQNFFRRALDAIVAGRTRQAERYIARFERDHPELRAARERVNGR
jgi:hypothetical protein